MARSLAVVNSIVLRYREQAKALEDRCPTDEELRTAKSYVKYMDCITREDHLRSIDELLAKVPNEFNAAVRVLEASEEFIMIAASGVVERVVKKLDGDWELINAVDVRAWHHVFQPSAPNVASGSLWPIPGCRAVLIAAALSRVRWFLFIQRDGHTALHSAAACNNAEVVSLLLTRGAKVNTQDVRAYGLAAFFMPETHAAAVVSRFAFS